MADGAKEKLVNFLDRKAFEPVLSADPDSYPQDKHNALKDVQDATRAERERFHDYDSAKEVYQMYEDDLTSEPAQEINRKLRDLDLPTLKDVRGEFEELAQEMGVRS
ncbi:hypothetical protein [Chelativorans sp. YIM 93263]|uniref:hypothetical protein n=1 Tax=Chelativorans sp. YIM 93263 TaxID=2906648 RepID=UPI002378FAC3|nr:hypothetical protein [Chelativorans sp. YIM 93263]